MQKVSHSAPTDFQKTNQLSCNSLGRVYVCLTHSLRHVSSSMETLMKRLIVLATLLTLLASASGCSMFSRARAQSCDPCDATSSAPLLGRLRLPTVSMPWRRVDSISEGRTDCNSCNEGFSEPTGFSEATDTAYSTGQIISEQIIGGQVVRDVVVNDQLRNTSSDTSISGRTGLYHPEVVGPVSHTNHTTHYAGELIPAPRSPAMDAAK